MASLLRRVMGRKQDEGEEEEENDDAKSHYSEPWLKDPPVPSEAADAAGE